MVTTTLKFSVCSDLFPVIAKHGFTIPQTAGEYSAVVLKISEFEKYRSLGYLLSLENGKLHPKDIAWIWRRVLSVAAVHADEKIEWSFNPDYEFIEPSTHKYLALSDLTASKINGMKWAAACMMELMSEDIKPLKNHFTAITKGAGDNIHPVQILLDFDYIIKKLWGERKFHKFVYPHGYK